MAQHTVAIQMVHFILDGVRERHGGISGILRRAGISPGLLESASARVSREQYAALMRTLRRVTRDELWGLNSKPVPPGSFAIICERMVRCSSIGDALHAAVRHYRLLITDFTPRLRTSDGVVSLTLQRRQPSRWAHDFLGATFLFYASQMLSWLAGRAIPVLRVEVAQARTAAQGTVSKLLGAPVSYGAAATGMYFDAACLQRPIVQNADSLAVFLQGVPNNLILRYRDPVSAAERVRNALKHFLGGPLPALPVIAAQLSISPATLRRRLHQENRSFQQIKDELRRDAAVAQLLHGRKALTSVAAYLGFSEASTFHRAFKQWTGVSPGEYRLRQQSLRSMDSSPAALGSSAEHGRTR